MFKHIPRWHPVSVSQYSIQIRIIRCAYSRRRREKQMFRFSLEEFPPRWVYFKSLFSDYKRENIHLMLGGFLTV